MLYEVEKQGGGGLPATEGLVLLSFRSHFPD